MEEKRSVDGVGAMALTGFAILLAFNQIVIKLTGGGFGPVFQAGLRSVLAVVTLMLWMRWQRLPLWAGASMQLWGVGLAALFAVEFIGLYMAIDMAPVSRVSVIFYSMPIWLALAGHFFLPGEQLSPRRGLGLLLAISGVALALLDRSGMQVSLAGDMLALLAAFSWMGIALMMRLTPLRALSSEQALLMQLGYSAPMLLIAAPFLGDLVRDLQVGHVMGLLFQSVCIASLGFLLWFKLIQIYKASHVGAFSFLSPVLAVVLSGWLLNEPIAPQLWGALGLVAVGVFLVNRK